MIYFLTDFDSSTTNQEKMQLLTRLPKAKGRITTVSQIILHWEATQSVMDKVKYVCLVMFNILYFLSFFLFIQKLFIYSLQKCCF